MTEPVVVKVGGSLLAWPELRSRLSAWLTTLSPAEVVLIPGGGAAADAVRELDRVHGLGDETAHWLAIRAMTLNAHFLAALVAEHPGGDAFIGVGDGVVRQRGSGARLLAGVAGRRIAPGKTAPHLDRHQRCHRGAGGSIAWGAVGAAQIGGPDAWMGLAHGGAARLGGWPISRCCQPGDTAALGGSGQLAILDGEQEQRFVRSPPVGLRMVSRTRKRRTLFPSLARPAHPFA